MKILKNKSVFYKLIKLFLLLILPITTLSLFALNITNRNLERETLQSVWQATKSFADDMDKDMEQIYVNTSNITSNSNLLKLSYASQTLSRYEKTQSIRIIRELITGVKSANPLVDNIRVYVESLNKAYNANNYIKGSVQTVTLEEFKSLSLLLSHGKTLQQRDGSLVMLLTTSLTNPVNIIEVEFSKKQFIKKLQSSSFYQNDYFQLSFPKLDIVMDTIPPTLSNLNRSTVNLSGASSSKKIQEIVLAGKHYHIFTAQLESVNGVLVRIVSDDALLKPMQLSSSLTAFFLVSICCCIVVFFIGSYRLIHRPLVKLTDAFHHIENGDFSHRIENTHESDFSYLYRGFNGMSDSLEQSIELDYNQKMLLQKAEFKQLQTQINPHFLYNSFFMLKRMISCDMQEEASLVSEQLGKYFRYITRTSMDLVPLKEEYEHAKIYADIQSMRFEGRIQVSFGVLPIDYEELSVPKLILQPIIENAFNYGLENKVSDGYLSVSFLMTDNHLDIMIEDNGEEASDEKIKMINQNLIEVSSGYDIREMTGILNIFKRLQILSKNRSTLTVTRSRLGGMNVNISLWNEQKNDD
jgi:two-component system sensor histidine kinase YesM